MTVPNTNFTYNDQAGFIEDECESEYELHEGLLVIPVMGDSTQTPVVIRLHPPYTTRKSDFRYARTRTPPVVPAPGDTPRGDMYLGGHLAVMSPTQNGISDLVYRVKGGYNFLVLSDVKTNGMIQFDKHGYQSRVDLLGYFKLNPDPNVDDTWNSPYFDLNDLASARILG